jgi:hypothetical protein
LDKLAIFVREFADLLLERGKKSSLQVLPDCENLLHESFDAPRRAFI